MENLNLENIRCITLKNTIRVLKNHKIYPLLRFAVGPRINNIYNDVPLKTGILRSRVHKLMSKNPFSEANSYEGVLRVMRDIEKEHPMHMLRINNGDNDQIYIQNFVMSTVNTILHYCVEMGVKDITIMETLGRESFEMTCKAIFGEDFVDNTGDRGRLDGAPEGLQRLIESIRNGSVDTDNPFIREIFREAMDRNAYGPGMVSNFDNPYFNVVDHHSVPMVDNEDYIDNEVYDDGYIDDYDF